MKNYIEIKWKPIEGTAFTIFEFKDRKGTYGKIELMPADILKFKECLERAWIQHTTMRVIK